MRKILLAATMLVPFAAFAGAPAPTMGIAGDLNLATTTANSTAGVQSSQGTQAQAKAGGNGGVIVGAVSGNYTSVETTALGKASPAGSYTDTTATQTNVGGTIAAGAAINKNGQRMPTVMNGGGIAANGASGSAGGGQTSQASGQSAASASNTNLGGFVNVTAPKQPHGGHTVR